MNSKYLHICSFVNIIKGLLVIPFGLICAEIISKIVYYASNGIIEDVKDSSFLIIKFIIFYQLLLVIINIGSDRVTEKANQHFRMDIYEKFLEKSFDETKTAGGIIKNFTKDINEIIKLYSVTYPSIATSTLMTLAYLIFIGVKDIKLALVILIISVIQIIPPVIIKKFMVKNYDNCIEIEGRITDYIIEGYNGASTIKLFNLYKYYLEGLVKFHKTYLQVGSKSELTSQSQNAMENGVNIILRFGTYSLIGFLVVKSMITMEIATKVIVLSGGLYSAINKIFTSIPSVSISKKAKEHVISLTQESVDLNNCIIKDSKGCIGNTIFQAQNLSFSYKDKLILKDISFNINEGDIVIISGANGSGKSTLLSIFLGIYKQYRGSICLYGDELKTLESDRYYDLISCALQEEHGFCKSLDEFFDILHQGKVINKPEAILMAKKFKINESLVDNERINKLSGGEKKKIYLIISLLKKSNILFLDEPSNSLDMEGKVFLKEFIKNCNKTVVLITHDPLFMDIATCKIEISDGKTSIIRGEF